MKYSASVRRGFLASLLVHIAVIGGGLLSADGSDKMVANKIEVYLTIPQQHPNEPPTETPQKQTNLNEALAPVPKHETVAKPIPKALPVVEAKTKVAPRSLPDKPLLEPELIVEKKPEIEPEPPIDAKGESPPDSLLVQEITPLDVAAETEPVEVIESQDVVDQEKIEALVEAEIRYRNEVVRLIESKKYYPKRLQKMRKEGEVLVAFTLNRDGSVQMAEVLNVKGSSLFKKAALKAVQSAALFPSFPQDSSRETWSFKVPLSYRLLRS